MAYDFGSAGLGINNPFKKEGTIRAIGGAAIAALGLFSIFKTTSIIEQDIVQAWVYALVGLFLLVAGLRRAGSGIFYLFKFFVGRSVPSSLAFNKTPSEADNAKQELKSKSLAYDSSTLESMLMGRKNTTFTEPMGWMGRFVHSIFPKLIFLPYPIRNILQEVVSVLATTLIAFIAFGLTYFVSSSGLAGQAGHIIIPAFSILLLIYLVSAWRSAANAVRIDRVKVLHSAGAASIAKVLTFSIVFPVVIGFGYQYLSPQFGQDDQLTQIFSEAQLFSAWPSLVILLVLGAIASCLVLYMVAVRTKAAKPVTEVSEFRENLQESVHPNEIFINIENIVLANRRFKEIPNRTYRAFEPQLEEQSQGKGSFSGELLIETQPEFKEVEQPAPFKSARLASTIAGQILLVIGAFLFFSLADQIGLAIEFVKNVMANPPVSSGHSQFVEQMQSVIGQGSILGVGMISTLFLWQIVSTIGRMLENFSNVFWSELKFESLLMYIKTEGTFSESKVSTGMSIHDSTRSENVVVKSSITPWVVSSRIETSTFATAGSQNVEMPRYVMSMTKNDGELQEIINEIRDFLKARENIAGFTNTADLQHAENILKVNEASRYNPNQLGLTEEEKAAGLLRNEQAQDHEP
ncbi:hypothetical protein [Psychrobium sp. 1_MG-2023]|uniref:hypothetical protein n=1 Tax=Psychrobium sp. 1_MG-2023 TaxID=3062624 RepID=UPI000C3320C4|nr:hypothetical protein [Psychrobium sp. 1_MG-2023]MDP2560462.1 hypothetical protein [Psychrobium sp. 1_MG-2023]PKF57878.1 hypothetical protein CW748_05000 [Alteromonadales bacterium alter-6D02]